MKQQNKVRDMSLMSKGASSAGNCRRVVKERQPRPDSFGDVGRACRAFLLSHGEVKSRMGMGSF